MSESIVFRLPAWPLLILACLFCMPSEVLCQTLAVPSTPPLDETQEKLVAETHLQLAGASLTKAPDGRIVGFQMPEGRGLNGQDWPLIFKLTDLQDLDLGAKHLQNEQLEELGKLTELRTLNLFGNPIDSISMSYLSGLQKLETLYLYRTFIDDQGVEWIAKLKGLKRLNMIDTFLTDKGLRTLGTCKQLTHLSIGNTKAGKFPEAFFTAAGIKQLRSDLPNTEIAYWGADDDELDVPKLMQDLELAKQQQKIQRLQKLPKLAAAPDLSTRTGPDWPRFLGITGDGKSSETGLNFNWNANPPKLAWHKKIGTGFAAPTISNGRLMLYQRVRNETGDQRFIERLACLHSETGEEIWQVDFPTSYQDLNGYGDGPRSAPVMDGDRVYVLSPEAMLRCLQCVDGKTIWEVDLKKDFDCDLITYGVGTSPVVFGNRLLVVVGGKLPMGGEATVVAFDKKTGVFQYGVGKGAASYASPVVRESQGRLWCFAFTRDGLLAFDPVTGKQDFAFPWRSNIAGCVNAATPVVENDRVLISESYGKGSAQLHFSSDHWHPTWQDSREVRKKSLLMHWATPIHHDGFVYGCSGRHSAHGVLKCIDWQSGATQWQQKVPDRSSLVYVDKHFISLGENGVLTLFKASPDGFSEVGRLDKNNADVTLSYPAWAAPVIARGLLYVRGKHEIICYDLTSK